MTANKMMIPASSGLASRRKNLIKKNLSLRIVEPVKTKSVDNTDAYLDGPIEIMPRLYLGSEKNTLDLDKLKIISIETILNVAAEVTHPLLSQTMIGYHKLNWEHNQDNLLLELQKAIEIIDKARSAGQNILVHCKCGVARSATVIIAYVMKSMKLSMQESYELVKTVSPAISPNLTLLFQLREYEQWIKKQIKHSRKFNNFSSIIWKTRTRSLFYN